jgi:hypothetical protein
MLQIAFIRESESNPGFKRNMDAKYCGRCHKTNTERRATQVELDGIFESNKLSKDIGEMMKTVKIESLSLKEKQF